MKATVRVDVERHVRDEAARRLAMQGVTIADTMCIVLEPAADGCGSDFGALVPNPTTVEAIEAARRGRRTRHPGRSDRRAQSGRLRTGAAPAPVLVLASGNRPFGRLGIRALGTRNRVRSLCRPSTRLRDRSAREVEGLGGPLRVLW